MNPVQAFAAIALCGVGLAQAHDLDRDQTRHLLKADGMQSVEALMGTVASKHPGARLEDLELEEQDGQYRYRIELRDVRGEQWSMELDAVTGQVLKDHRERP